MIKIKKLTEDAIVPHRSREGDACFDLYSINDYVVLGRSKTTIPTGIAIELPVEYEAEIRPRSGISLNGLECKCFDIDEFVVADIDVIQGTIDSNYRGQINIIVRNNSNCDIVIPKYTKLAQMKINHVPDVKLVEVEELSDSNRGTNGFGSSGI